MENHHLLLFALAIITGNFAWLMCFREELRIDYKTAFGIAVLHDIIGYSAMKFWAIVEVGGDLSRAVDMRLFGAVFVLPLFYYAGARRAKRNVAMVMDISAICLVIGLICGRLNCLYVGCCVGTDIWGLQRLKWPLRETELIFYFGFIAYFGKKIYRKQTYGQIYALFMFLYGGMRFLMEWVRVEYTTRVGIFHLAHIWALLSFCVGASIYFELQSRKKRVKR